MENKTVSENALIVIGIFFPTLLDDVTQLSLNNVRLLWCNKKRQKLIQEGKEMNTKMYDR